MKRIFFALVLLAALAPVSCSKNGGGEAQSPAAPGGSRPALERAEPLPDIARDLLRENMIEHGDSMESLLWSALMLEHEMTEVVVAQILGQPRMARPSSGDADTVNAALPAEFYDLQDQMFSAAEELRLAAAQRDDIATARFYAQLTETCVTCHALYLSLPGTAGR
ncbi:MAG: hypothetical protein AAGC55_17885 [Myxococcota bacterium]